LDAVSTLSPPLVRKKSKSLSFHIKSINFDFKSNQATHTLPHSDFTPTYQAIKPVARLLLNKVPLAIKPFD